MRSVYDVAADGVSLAHGEALDALQVSRLSGNENVGWREERRGLIAVDEVASVEVVLLIDGVVDAGDKLVVGGLRRNGVGDITAIAGVIGRIDCRQIFLKRESLRIVGRRAGIFVAWKSRSCKRIYELGIDGVAGACGSLAAYRVSCGGDGIGNREISSEIGSRGDDRFSCGLRLRG